MKHPRLVATYTGPWSVPKKRAKKDPTAPKRNPSTFLLFAQGKRQELKKLNPGKTNADISCILGKLWRSASVEEKRHYIEREAEERAQYKTSIAEWRKQQEKRQSTGEVESITVSPVTTIGSGIGRKVQLVILEDNVVARVHSGDDGVCDLNQRVLDDPISSKDNYGTSLYPPPMMRNGSALRYHSPTQYSPSIPQHNGSNIVNDRYFSPIPFHDNYEPIHPESHAQQTGYTNALSISSYNDPMCFLQNSIEQEGHVIHHSYHHQEQQQHHTLASEKNIATHESLKKSDEINKLLQNSLGQEIFENSDEINQLLQTRIDQKGCVSHHQYHRQKQHHPFTLEQNIAKQLSFENSDEIDRQYVSDETKEVEVVMDNIYNQHQNYSAQDNMKQKYGNLNRQHYTQQPGQHAKDQDSPHNLPSEKLDNTQQLWASLRCGEGLNSPLNMYDNR